MGKGSSKGHTPREARDNLKSTQLLSVIDAISEGPVEGPVDGLKSVLLNSTPVLDSEGNTNISGVTVVFRAGEQEQTPPEGFESSGSETVLGTEVKYDTPITRTITSANIDRLRFTFGVQALVETTSKGDRNPSEVRLLVQIQRNGGWVTEKDITIKGKTTSQYLASVVVDNLPPRPFNIRMRRMTPDSTTDQLQNKTLWSSYTEIIDVKQCYPNTALVGVLTDRQAQRESEEQRLREVYGDNPVALAKATSALKNTWSAEEQLRGSWMAGMKSGWGEWAESATDSFSQVKNAATQTFDGIAQNMAAMLTGSEQNWRGFTRSVLSMLTEIFLKQAMVGIVGSIGSAIGGAVGGGASASGGTAIQAAAANFHFATGGFTGTGGKYEPAGIVHRGEFVFTKEATSRIGVGNLYRLMRGYAEGGYVGGAGSPAQMRRAEGINFNQNNHVVIQNDGPNGRAGPQLMKAVYEMARKGAQDELRLQLRDGGMLSGSGG
ncbi:phage tail tape measure protein [Shigella sonnei]|uniref:phage tail tape measure protein n=1 Tax=Shigella sonnei TaxID=624 RepID=UPI000663DFC5|nr:minor tail protein H [Shigella sonnei]